MPQDVLPGRSYDVRCVVELPDIHGFGLTSLSLSFFDALAGASWEVHRLEGRRRGVTAAFDRAADEAVRDDAGRSRCANQAGRRGLREEFAFDEHERHAALRRHPRSSADHIDHLR